MKYTERKIPVRAKFIDTLRHNNTGGCWVDQGTCMTVHGYVDVYRCFQTNLDGRITILSFIWKGMRYDRRFDSVCMSDRQLKMQAKKLADDVTAEQKG